MSQLKFFLTTDEMNTRLNDLILSEHFKVFNGSFFDTEKPVPISTIDDLKTFSRTIIWVKNEHEEAICASKGLGAYKNKFLFDYYKQPIIEVDNCKIINKLISPGRVYYKAGWIDNADLRKLHKRMAERIKRFFSKGLLPISPPFKISSGIKALMSEGYEIELGDGGMKIN